MFTSQECWSFLEEAHIAVVPQPARDLAPEQMSRPLQSWWQLEIVQGYSQSALLLSCEWCLFYGDSSLFIFFGGVLVWFIWTILSMFGFIILILVSFIWTILLMRDFIILIQVYFSWTIFFIDVSFTFYRCYNTWRFDVHALPYSSAVLYCLFWISPCRGSLSLGLRQMLPNIPKCTVRTVFWLTDISTNLPYILSSISGARRKRTSNLFY